MDDKTREYFRQYYQNNRDKILQKMKDKELTEEDVKRIKEYYKEYYEENKEKLNEYSKNWKKENREKWNAYQRQKGREYYHKKKNMKKDEE